MPNATIAGDHRQPHHSFESRFDDGNRFATIPRVIPIVRLAGILFLGGAVSIRAAGDYGLGPDSKPQPGVPKGEVLKFSFESSKIFPGTYRDYWIYVPAQYTPDHPACLYVNQDGLQWEAPTVFDNLIHKKEMPITVGVFVMHGRVRAADTNAALDRFNRSYEYDGLGENYARFLINELLPEVEKQHTSDGRVIRISTNANDRAIGGSSSGAVCAFTAAWERPDSFSRVFSAVGTYVGLRGADRYPTLIRKYEPKPLRIFLQDGTNDLNIYAGDWWVANQLMERALSFAGYEVNHVWGEGGHDGKHGAAIFPDAMRWLWKDWPQPVKRGQSKNDTLAALLIPGEEWESVWKTSDVVRSQFGEVENLTANADGEVFFNQSGNDARYRIGNDGRMLEMRTNTLPSTASAFGPDGRLFCVGLNGLFVRDSRNQNTRLSDLQGSGIIVRHNGDMYVTSWNSNISGRVWLVRESGEKKEVARAFGRNALGGITLSADQTLLFAADSFSHWIYSYQIQADGTLDAKQKYFWLQMEDESGVAGARSMCVDREGRLYVSTLLGVQVCDQAGRVQCILPLPAKWIDSLCFGGKEFDTLYVSCVTSGGLGTDKILRRKLNTRGAQAFDPPIKPAAPRL